MSQNVSSFNADSVSSYLQDNQYRYSNFTERNKQKFFLNDFMHYERHPGPITTMGMNGYLDLKTEYSINSHGFRTKELEAVDVIFSGDSFTYGVGLPENATWAAQISEAMGYNSLNLGWPGASVTGVVNNLMHYFKVYGNPKYLFCMFSDFSRMHVFLNSNILVSSNGTTGGFTEMQLAHLGELDDRPKYSKKPYNIEEVLNLEIPYYYSLKAIQFLEQYCEQAGIKFLWSMFHAPDHEAIRVLKDNEFGYYKDFLDTNQGCWMKDQLFKDAYLGENTAYQDKALEHRIYCHEDLRSKYGSYFDLGGDIEQGMNMAHHGAHRHVHVAEVFLEKIKDL